MKIAIVDDLPGDREQLKTYLARYLGRQQLTVEVKAFASGESFLSALEGCGFELVFLDIYMEGIDGVSLARVLRSRSDEALVVFITTSRGHAVEGFEVRAFYYLVKPYTYEDFEHVMQLCERALLRQARYLDLPEGHGMTRVLLSEITCARADGHYTAVSLASGGQIRARMGLAAFAARLDSRFVLCGRRTLVNMDQVEALAPDRFLLRDGDVVPIPKRVYGQVQDAYFRYALRISGECGGL